MNSWDSVQIRSVKILYPVESTSRVYWHLWNLVRFESLTISFSSFLEKIDEISQPNYLASDEDILRSRRRTTEIQKLEFQMKVPSKYGGGTQLFW